MFHPDGGHAVLSAIIVNDASNVSCTYESEFSVSDRMKIAF
jgi:hypothetical protein